MSEYFVETRRKRKQCLYIWLKTVFVNDISILSHYHDGKNDFSKCFPQCKQMKKKMNLIKFSFHYLQREEVSLDIMFLSCSVEIKSGYWWEMEPSKVIISFNKTWKNPCQFHRWFKIIFRYFWNQKFIARRNFTPAFKVVLV